MFQARFARSFRSIPLLVGILGILAGGALLVFRVPPTWLGLSALAVGIFSLSLAQWWERRGVLTAWIPFLLGAAVLLGGLVLWRDLRIDETDDMTSRLDREEEVAVREVRQVLSQVVDTAYSLTGQNGVPRSFADVQADFQAAFEANPPLLAVELVRANDQYRLLEQREGEAADVSPPDPRIRSTLFDAAERVRATGEAHLLGPFPGPGDELILRVLVPVPSPVGAPAGAAPDVLSSVYYAGDTFEELRERVSPLFALRLQAGGQNLYSSGIPAEGREVRRQTLKIRGGRDWVLEVVPTEALIEEERTGLAEIALGVSLALALLLTLSTWFGGRAARRARAFEAAVAERTAELEAARADAQAANEAKDRFLAMLGHELRNPLASINTALEVLRRQEADAGIDERTGGDARMRGIVQRQMNHMARLVDDLLDVSRIERGKLPLKREPLDLVRLVRDVADAERARLDEAGIEFEVETPDRPLWIDGDPTRLTQVVYNLLSNATKFTERGGTIAVSVTEAAGEDDGEAALAVRDSGAGIEAEDLERIFEPFAQTELGIERSTGLGLGLPIVKGLIEAHDGAIRAVSDGPGTGTTVEIRLPLRDAPPDAAEEDGPIAEEAVAAGARRVLVIDDHTDSREALRDLLQVFGHEVEVAKDGSEGVRVAGARVADGGLDVVICDIGLPGELDGYGVAERLRGTPETATLRLVALTGWSDDASVKRALESGFDQHITKPVDPALLREILAEQS